MSARSTAPGTVVVIGGGISGIATAALLARAGHSVTVVEARDELGGRAGLHVEGGFRFDTGPSWYLMPEVFDHFFALLGTSAAEQLDLVRLDPGYRVFFEHADAIDIAADRAENVARFEAVEPGAGAALERYLDSAADTYDVALRRFLYGTFASYRPLLRRDVLTRLPTLARLLLEPLDTLTGRYFRDPRLRQILGYPAVFLGSSPYVAPSMYHLMSHLDLNGGVLYPQGGFTEIIAAIVRLAEAEGVRFRTGTPVERIDTAVFGAREKPVAVGVTTTAGEFIPADLVVGAADLHHVETTMLPPEYQTYPQRYWEKAVAGPSAVLVSLGVSGELPELEHHSLFFTEDWADNFGRIFNEPTSVPDPASIYVCRPSATDPSVAPEGHENLFILVPVPADPGIGSRGDERVTAIADAAIAQVAAWAKIPDLAERIVVRRDVGPGNFESELRAWQGTALGPAHVLRQSAMFRAGNISKRVDGLLYAGGSTIPGIGLPMCLISAELVLKRTLGDTGTEPLPTPLNEAP